MTGHGAFVQTTWLIGTCSFTFALESNPPSLSKAIQDLQRIARALDFYVNHIVDQSLQSYLSIAQVFCDCGKIFRQPLHRVIPHITFWKLRNLKSKLKNPVEKTASVRCSLDASREIGT